ncbi:MAG: transcription antitermination factor NusB [Planctomycetes bacterium]|nr:transcription antitermination factor NusB [Planctomycetota bacterium]
MRKRTRARELALQFLYQVDLCGEETLKSINDFFANETKDQDVIRFAGALARGTWEYRKHADELICNIAKNWDLKRMAVIDRNILRMGVYEMHAYTSTPAKVIINEAIELGKRYSTQHSGKFINGILDRAMESVRETARPAGDAPAAADVPALDQEEESQPQTGVAGESMEDDPLPRESNS